MFKASEHKFLLKWTGGTTAVDINVHEIPISETKFKPFAEIISGKWRPDILVNKFHKMRYGNFHPVQFNKSMTIPILTTGWHQFRNSYHVTLNPLMSFTFLENSTFLIKIFNGSTPKKEYPRYHRLTTSITRDLTFQMTIPSKYPMSSKLVIILFFSCTYLFQF